MSNESMEARMKALEAKLSQGLSELENEKKKLATEQALFQEQREKLYSAAEVAGVRISEDDDLAAEEPKEFDKRTHIRHPKSGKVIAVNHYALHCVKGPDGNTQRYFERPPGSGKFFFANNEIAPTPPGYVKPQEKKRA